jgi:cation diffusion facilitator CzcD-associated flavoprotein CzcO/acetyl esterase/lipase
MLDDASERFLAELAASGAPPVHELTPEQAREAGKQMAERHGAGPAMTCVENLTITTPDGGQIPLRVLVPTQHPRALIVYYHGGGWVIGGLDQSDALARRLAAATQCAVVLVDYRLAPEHRYPTAVEDAWTALLWIAENVAEMAGGAVPLIVAGDSAGGNLATVVARRARDEDGPELALQVLVYPVTDCDLSAPSYLDPANQLLLSRETMKWFWDHYAPVASSRVHPDASPLRTASLAGLPPALIATAEHDVLRDEGEAYAERLANAGVRVQHKRFDGQMHTFLTMVNILPGADDAIEWIAQALDRELAEPEVLDAIVVGAGFSGLYALHRLRGLGLSVRVLEQGAGVGGTWYWNRYPGVRCDIESVDYSYSFSPELEQEWEWTERYPTGPEILRYLNHVADRFDLRRDIQLNTRMVGATLDEQSGRWEIRTADGTRYVARWCVMASGCLSSVNRPEFDGLEDFEGAWCHSARWPEDVDLAGKRVGVIGTGSTGIQLIPQLAKQAGHLYVFQRTANFSMPAQNRPLDADTQRAVKADYSERRRLARESRSGIPSSHPSAIGQRSALEVTPQERRTIYERGWAAGGIGGVMLAFNDINVNPEANHTAAEFVRGKIRQIVRDPATAQALCPTTHPIGTKRLCVDIDYYETYNRDNVTLVDVGDDPIKRVTARGLETGSTEYELDVIVFATGFDAITGALLEVDIRGRGGQLLRDKWSDGPRTYLGLATAGFPNLFLVTGPGSPSVLSNMVCSIEQHVDWIADCIAYMGEHDLDTIEAGEAAEDSWVAHVNEVANATLFPKASSWYLGANIPGKPRVFMPYLGGVGHYRTRCEEIAAADYDGFALSGRLAGATR